MTKYRMRVETKVYFTVEVIAEDEESAKEMITENVKIEEYANESWGVEISSFDDSIYDRIDSIEVEAADEFFEENISLDEIVEEDIEIPDDEEEEDW